MKLRGAQKIAAVLLGLDKETAARLLKGLPDAPLESISQAMVELADRSFKAHDVEPALQEFWSRIADGSTPVNDFQDLLNEALGEDRARAHVERLAITQEQRAPFGPLEQLPPQDVADVLLDENEQVCALVLAQLRPLSAARILERFPSERRPQLLQRVARCGHPPPALLERIASSLLERLGPTPPRRRVEDPGLTAAASILNFLSEESEQTLAGAIQSDDEELFQAIDERRVTMEDLIGIDKKAMQKVLAGIDTRVLTMALKGATKEIESAILDNVSKRSRDSILEERELLGSVPLHEVDAARRELLATVRNMIKSGEVVLRRSGGEGFVD